MTFKSFFSYFLLFMLFLNKDPYKSFFYARSHLGGFSGRAFFIMARKVKLSTLKNKLDKIFSEYIRRRDVDNHTGYGKCVDCGKETHFSEGDAGHFVGRRHLSTRWSEDNVHFQHRYCNRFLNGRQYEYGKAVDSIYYKGKADELVQESHKVAKFDAAHLQYLIDIYKEKLDSLKKIQSF